jgi:hypothetical protein
MAPAKPGRVEAPLRSARRRQARGPIDRSGIKVKQFCARVPIIFEPQSGGGTVIRSIRTADIRIIGESASAQPRTPNEAAGWAARSIAAVAANASGKVTANLARKRVVPIAQRCKDGVIFARGGELRHDGNPDSGLDHSEDRTRLSELKKDLHLCPGTRKRCLDYLTASRCVAQHDKPSTGELRPTHVPIFRDGIVATAYETEWIVHQRLNV